MQKLWLLKEVGTLWDEVKSLKILVAPETNVPSKIQIQIKKAENQSDL